MIISIHIGAHATYGSKLARGLWKNREVLAENGVIVPPSSRYREVLPQVMRRVKGKKASDDLEEMVLDQIIETDDCRRVVMSYEDVVCLAPYVFDGGHMYGKADFKLRWLRNVFPNHQMEFHLGVRNPATFIPELCPSPASYPKLIGDTDLEAIKWSNVVKNIREVCPDVALSVFAYEDTPLTWGQVMREVSGADPSVPLAGGLDILGLIMKREGMKRLRTYLHTHAPQNDIQRQKILAAFLDKYVDESAIEEEIDLPGWDEALIERLTERYEQDLYEIEDISGVRFILP